MSTTQGLGEHTVRVSTTVALSRGNLGLYWHQTGKEERIISRFGSTVVEHFWYYHCPLADIDYVPLYSTANKGYMFHYVLWQQIDGFFRDYGVDGSWTVENLWSWVGFVAC
ncbi:uncharacterized protein LOC114264765 isoform X3 [Camellia sinensis]|uniref:uncharacterized protein LOC114264765 isoform X3 n=1 Tax=Camellia sinensis TaxID=4442 RepID=UPI00103565CA|nr:uncharacterized protein LOC114264765 isoform X3 [Camellia sinensis]